MGIQYGQVNYISKYGQPSLDLQFSGPKGSLKDRMGDVEVEFTRSSVGTYVGSDGLIKTAVDDEARFDHDPTTGESLGLLIEEARTNVSEYSVPSTANGWDEFEGTLTASATTAPDGTTTAATFIENTASSNNHRTNLDKFGGVSGTTYTSSVFVKAAGRTRFQLTRLASSQVGTISAGSWGAEVDLAAGTITSTTTATSIQALANGWFRVSASYTMTGDSSNTNLLIYLEDDTGNRDYTGDGASGIEVWGGQHEAGSFPTSYIPTSGSTVTRAADIAQITGDNFSSWYNQSEGTFTVDLQTPLVSVNNSDYIFSANDGSTGDNVAFRYVTYSTRWFACGSQIEASPQSNDAVTGKYSMAWDSSTIGVALDGISASVASGTVLTTATTLNIFTGGAGSRPVYGTLARLSFYPTRLTDSQLQALTL
jgi:hypothetical protein